jgi:hypothetical protein
MITSQDLLRHSLPDVPNARESMMWSHCLPDEGLFINPYLWIGSDGGSGRALILTEQGRSDMLLLDIEQGLQFQGGDLDDFRIGELTVRQPEPLRTAEVRFASGRCELEYRFTAAHDAFDYGSNQDGCPWYMAFNRYEQSGIGEGRLRIDDREITITGSAHHDHSWGVRDWDAMQHYKWISAQSGPDVALNVMVTHYRGEQTLNGYVFREGLCSPIVAASLHADYDDDFFASHATAELRDEAGRQTTVETKTYARFTFPVSERAVLLDSVARASINGQPGVAQLDFLWPISYAEHQRELTTAGLGQQGAAGAAVAGVEPS